MQHHVKAQLTSFITAAAVALAAACSDGGGTAPRLPDRSAVNGGGDTTSTQSPPAQPVAHYDLTVRVGTPRAGSADTLTLDPVGGAAVAVVQRSYVRNGNASGDTLSVTETVVATGTTGTDGVATFAALDGGASYVIRAQAPAGSGYADAGASLGPAYANALTMTLVLRKP